MSQTSKGGVGSQATVRFAWRYVTLGFVNTSLNCAPRYVVGGETEYLSTIRRFCIWDGQLQYTIRRTHKAVCPVMVEGSDIVSSYGRCDSHTGYAHAAWVRSSCIDRQRRKQQA